MKLSTSGPLGLLSSVPDKLVPSPMPPLTPLHIATMPYGTGKQSSVPDFFDRNKILSGYDLSHYQVPHCIRVFFYFV